MSFGPPLGVPVPVSERVCGLPVASPVTAIMPDLVPVAEGVNVTLMVQAAPPCTVLPQLLVWAKSPEATMLVILNGPAPVSFKVAGKGGLVVPTG